MHAPRAPQRALQRVLNTRIPFIVASAPHADMNQAEPPSTRPLTSRWRDLPSRLLKALPLCAATLATAWQAWALHRAIKKGRQLVLQTVPFEAHPPGRTARVLLLGDSTGVGVGTEQPQETIGGLLAADYPGVEIVNRCLTGARMYDVTQQLVPLVREAERFDLAVVMAGGNDVIKLTPHRQLARDARRMLAALTRVSKRSVWLGSANLGGSPLLLRPLSWWLGFRSVRVMRLLAREAKAYNVQFINFAYQGRADLFANDPDTFFAIDGIHPSGASYRHCFNVMKRQAPLKSLLTRNAVHRPIEMPAPVEDSSPAMPFNMPPPARQPARDHHAP